MCWKTIKGWFSGGNDEPEPTPTSPILTSVPLTIPDAPALPFNIDIADITFNANDQLAIQSLSGGTLTDVGFNLI